MASSSPHVNPIENAWAILKKRLRVRPRFATNVSDLFDMLQEECVSIPDTCFINLVRSMPARDNLLS